MFVLLVTISMLVMWQMKSQRACYSASRYLFTTCFSPIFYNPTLVPLNYNPNLIPLAIVYDSLLCEYSSIRRRIIIIVIHTFPKLSTAEINMLIKKTFAF